MHVRISSWAVALVSAVLLAGCSGGGSVPTAQTAGAPQNAIGGAVPQSAGVAAGLQSGSMAASPKTTDLAWPNYGMNVGLSGGNPSETTLSATNVSGLQLLWTTSAANIAGVWAVVEDAGTLFVESEPNNEAYVTAINPTSGAQLWSAETYTFSNYPGIAAGDGLVFAPCEIGGSVQDQSLCAFRQTTGKLAWSYSDNCNCDPPSVVNTPPVYDSGVVYLGYSYGSTGQNGMFLALNAKTGATLWSYGCASNCGLTFSGATPAVGNGAVYFGCSTRSLNGGLCALEASNGNLLWTYQAGTGNAAVSVSDGTVYMEQELSGNTDEPIVALNSSGSPLWTTTLACCGNLSPPAVGGGRVYALVSGNALEALNAKTGKVSWTSSPSCGGEDSSPSIANGVVYVTPGVHCSDTFALDAKNGTLLWDAPTGGRGYGAPPIILNGTLYAQCWNMCAYDLSSAEVKRGSPIR